MAQARKKVRKQVRRKRPRVKSSAGWGMLLIGLISGVTLTTLYFGAQSGDETQFGNGLKALFAKHRAQGNRGTSTQPSTAPVRVPAPTAKFDFYTVLPEIERVLPDDFTDSELETKKNTKPVTYALQAASYENYADADRLKATLALSGFDASIQKVVIEGRGVYHRVRLGPYRSKRKMKNDKQRLAKLGIRSLPLRITAD